MNPVVYDRWPVFWAVIKHFQWYVQERNPFNDYPVLIKFPIPTLENQTKNDPSAWIVFEWQCYHPRGDTLEDWKRPPVDKTEFAKIYFIDDAIFITYLKEHHVRDSWTMPVTSRGFVIDITAMHDSWRYDHKIQLCDPNIDFNKEIIRWAKKGFVGFGRWLRDIE
jgi:hypothetical protein